MSDKNQYGKDVVLTAEDNSLKNDLIVGRDPILEILKLSHWNYMKPYLVLPGCPIIKVGRKWLTRRSLLDSWLTEIMTSGAKGAAQ